MIKTFKDIIVWQIGYKLTLLIYKYTADFPKNEEFGLKSELRRACVSYISNIAEGYKKRSIKEAVHYYNRSETSLEEVKCQSMLSYDLNYFTNKQFKEIEELYEEAGKTLDGWIKSQEKFI